MDRERAGLRTGPNESGRFEGTPRYLFGRSEQEKVKRKYKNTPELLVFCSLPR